MTPGDAARLDRTFEAIVVDWEGVSDPNASMDAVRAGIEALSLAGVHVAIMGDLPAADLDAQLRLRPRGPGLVWLCADKGREVCEVAGDGPTQTWTWRDPAERPPEPDAVQWVLARLDDRGIGSGLVLVARGGSRPPAPPVGRAVAVDVGDEAGRLVALLDEQLRRRDDGRTPSVDEDPRWSLTLDDDPRLERVHEALATLADGRVGLRGAFEEGGETADPLLVAAGVYQAGDPPTLLPGPLWADLLVGGGGTGRRVLDLRTGVLYRERPAGGRNPLRTLRFLSLDDPGAMALRAEGDVTELAGGAPLRVPSDGRPLERGAVDGVRWARTRSGLGGGITVAVSERERSAHGRRTVERLASCRASARRVRACDEVVAHVHDLERKGFDRLLAEHRAAWARRWRDVGVVIEGDPDAELAARFALFHLMASATRSGEAAVGARGVSGAGYGGHVFWDADVFVLPALAAVQPESARAMLEYRVRRLPAARKAAERLGRVGARFPWESAADGQDVTPRAARIGHWPVPIRTGLLEEHITADVAWAAHTYAAWSGDHDFLRGPGRGLVTETARYWASRARVDRDGRAHVYGVIGPDEYHEPVDDNAFTNVMIRWHLRRAAELVERAGGGAPPDEVARWRALADALVDGYDQATGRYEQFAGFWGLEPLLIADVAQPPVAADLLLGRERLARTQVIKQPDVLMLHHLVPDETAAGSLRPNLDFYGPRTAHGSSLSPAIHAALLARSGDPDGALPLFRLASRLDLDDLTGTTAAGLHLATMGGLWQALATGFLGLRPTAGGLEVDPWLPSAWEALELGLYYRGSPLRVRATRDRLTVTTTRPLRLLRPDGSSLIATPPGQTVRLTERTVA